MRFRCGGVILCAALLVGHAGVPVAAQTSQAISLDDAVATALERHPSITAAAKAVEAAEARLVQARAGMAVQVSIGGRTSVGTLSATGSPTGGEATAVTRDS